MNRCLGCPRQIWPGVEWREARGREVAWGSGMGQWESRDQSWLPWEDIPREEAWHWMRGTERKWAAISNLDGQGTEGLLNYKEKLVLVGWVWDLWFKGETGPGSWNYWSGEKLVVQTNLGGIGMEGPTGEDRFSKRSCLYPSELVAHPRSILCPVTILTPIPVCGIFLHKLSTC